MWQHQPPEISPTYVQLYRSQQQLSVSSKVLNESLKDLAHVYQNVIYGRLRGQIVKSTELFCFLELEAHLWICFSSMSENAKSDVFFEISTFEGMYLSYRDRRK